LEEKHNKMKEVKQGIWYEDGELDALNRFSQGRIKKNFKNSFKND
jgi:hypothetical protein